MNDVTLDRLGDQIAYYDRTSAENKRWYKGLKAVELVAAAAVPFCAGFDLSPWITGTLSVTVVVLEGLLHLNQFHAQWHAFRSTCEALKHEKFLYLAKASHYAEATDAHALLAIKVEELVSREHANWIDSQQKAAIKAGAATPAR